MSEKYDGVRALWDGRVAAPPQRPRRRRRRRRSSPPCRRSPLDGELWLGRGRFDALSALVRTRASRTTRDWADVRYLVFELPVPAAPSPSAPGASSPAAGPHLLAAGRGRRRRARRRSDRALRRRLARTVVGRGGEGLMLHVADRPPTTRGRSDVLLKLKPQLDAEAIVVGHRAGQRQVRRARRRARGRDGAGPTLLRRQRPRRRAAPRAAADRHDGHLPLPRPDAERRAALRDLPAAARRHLSVAVAPCRLKTSSHTARPRRRRARRGCAVDPTASAASCSTAPARTSRCAAAPDDQREKARPPRRRRARPPSGHQTR